MALTQNYLSKSSDGVDLDHLTDSIIYDDGTNVGIGTNSPSCKLDIKGYSSYPAVIVGPVNNCNGIIDCKTQNDNRVAAFRCIRTAGTYATTWEIRTPENSKSLAFYNGGDKVTITDGGNVGIGTTSPNNKLEVNGTVQCDGLRIDTTVHDGTLVLNKYFVIYLNGSPYCVPCAEPEK